MADVAHDYFEQSLQILRESEADLQRILAEAAQAGDYDALAKITACAKGLRDIVDRCFTQDTPAQTISRNRKASRKYSGSYPKFFKTNDNKLVVIGWSKKHQTEYEHKAPKSVLDQLIQELLKWSKSGEPIPIESLIPQLKSDDGSISPIYYGRAFLRWLREKGLVTRQGHQGYLVSRPDSLESEVVSYWRRLSNRQSQ
jgi:hypothetical protein